MTSSPTGMSSVAFFTKRLQDCEQEIKLLQRQLRNSKAAKNRAEKRAAELDQIFEKKLEHHTTTRVSICEKNKDVEIEEWKNKYADLLMRTQGMKSTGTGKLVAEEEHEAVVVRYKMEQDSFRSIITNLTEQNKALAQQMSRIRRKHNTLSSMHDSRNKPVTEETIEEWRSLCKHFIVGKWVNNLQTKKKLKEVMELMMRWMHKMSQLFTTDPHASETIVVLDEEPEIGAWLQASKFMQRKGSKVSVWAYLRHIIEAKDIVDQTLGLCAEREKRYQKLTDSVFDRNAAMASEILDLQSELETMELERSHLNNAIGVLQTEMTKGQAKMETRIRCELQHEVDKTLRQSEQRQKIIRQQSSKIRMMRIAMDRYKGRITELTGKTALSTVQKMIQMAKQNKKEGGGLQISDSKHNNTRSFGVPVKPKVSSHKTSSENDGKSDPWTSPDYEHVLVPQKPPNRLKSPRGGSLDPSRRSLRPNHRSQRRPRTATARARGCSPINSSRVYPNPYLDFDPNRHQAGL